MVFSAQRKAKKAPSKISSEIGSIKAQLNHLAFLRQIGATTIANTIVIMLCQKDKYPI